MMTENMTLNNDTRVELQNFASELLYKDLHDTIMRNLSMLEESNRFYNWYHGFTELELPFYQFRHCLYWGFEKCQMFYSISTVATSGSISTKYFGEKFDANKVEREITYDVDIYVDPLVSNNPNVTLHVEIEKNAINVKDLSTGDETYDTYHDNSIIASTNFTPPGGEKSFELDRGVSLQEMENQKMNLMPGFRITWYYTGIEDKQPYREWSNTFVRKSSIYTFCN